MSPGLRKMCARAAAAVPFAAAAARLISELAGITVTGKRAGRRAEADGQAAAAVIEAQAAAVQARALVPLPPAPPLPDIVYVAIDGTGVPVTAAEAEGRPGKGEDGTARTREVKMAVVFTQTSLDEDGRPVRDPASSRMWPPSPRRPRSAPSWPPRPGRRRSAGRNPDPAQPGPRRRSLTQHLNTHHTQTAQPSRSYQPVTYILVPSARVQSLWFVVGHG